MCSLQRNYDVIRNWARFETGPLTVQRVYVRYVLAYEILVLINHICTAVKAQIRLHICGGSSELVAPRCNLPKSYVLGLI